MSDINRVLFTAKESLLSHLTAINVTGSNISNVSTAGYSRLRPIFESVGTKDASSSQTQVGVKIAEVQRVYDKFLVSQLVAQEAQVGDSQAQSDLLTRIEGILNETTGGGINDALNEFWSAWGDLSTNPSGKAQRDALVSVAQNLTNMFQQRTDDLNTIQEDANQSIADTVTTLNGYVQEMSVYNDEIVATEIAGGQANDLRDKRDELLRKISSIVDVNYLEKSNGSLYVYLSNGKALVEETNTWFLDVRSNADNSNLYDVVFADDPEESLNDYLTAGKLSGLITIRDNIIPAYIDELNQTAASIINKVNQQHALGYDQDGNIGGTFFTQTDEAKYMEVSSAIIADTRKIAASATVNGDGDNAQAIVSIQDDQIYASLERVISPDAAPAATSAVVGAGAGLTLDDSIVLTRGATAGSWNVTSQTNYPSMAILSADATTVEIDADGDAVSDISLTLSGTWEQNDTAAFTISAAGPAVSAVTVTDNVVSASHDHYATGSINNIGQIYKNTLTDHPITITRGAAVNTWTVTDNGGYDNLTVLSADSKSVALDMDGNGTADITLNLSGTWEQNDTLSFSLTKSESTTTIGGYYNAFIGRLGQDVANASTSLDRQTTIINQFIDQREALSGVSLDEEMLNLVKYQMGYSAAARLTNIVTEMMDLLINLGK